MIRAVQAGVRKGQSLTLRLRACIEGADRAGVTNLRGGRGCRGSILRSRRWPLFENTNSRGGAVSLYLQAEIRILLVDIKENFYASFRYQ